MTIVSKNFKFEKGETIYLHGSEYKSFPLLKPDKAAGRIKSCVRLSDTEYQIEVELTSATYQNKNEN